MFINELIIIWVIVSRLVSWLKNTQNCLTSVDMRPTLNLKKHSKFEISLRYSKGSKLRFFPISL